MVASPVSYLKSGKKIILTVTDNKNSWKNKRHFKSVLQHSSLIPVTKIIGEMHVSHTEDLRYTPEILRDLTGEIRGSAVHQNFPRTFSR